MQLLGVFSFFVIWGCVPQESPFGFALGDDVDRSGETNEPDQVQACPVAGMILVPGVDQIVLGSTECVNAPNTFRVWEFQWIEPYCMGEFPFPGEGYTLVPSDEDPDNHKLSYGDVARINKAVEAYGLRLCTMAETLWAAGGPDNLQFTYGNKRVDDLCGADGDADGGSEPGYSDPIGSHTECESWAGIRDIGTRGVWQWLDDQSREALNTHIRMEEVPWASNTCWWGHEFTELDDAMEIVVGGTYASQIDENSGELVTGLNTSGDNWGWHHHLYPVGAFYDEAQWPDGNEWTDDTLRFCSDTTTYDPDIDAAWQTVVEAFKVEGNYDVLTTL